MRNKKTVLTAVGILTSACLLCSTAFVALANNSGYEKFKKATLNTMQVKSVTVNATAKVVFDDHSMETEAIMYTDGTKQYSEHQSLLDGVSQKSGASYSDDNGTTIYMDNKILSEFSFDNAGTMREMRHESDALTEKQARFFEVLLDTMIGDTKNYFLAEDNKVYINLEEHQIPTLVQLGTSAMSEAIDKEAGSHMANFGGQDVSFSDISVKSFSATGEIGDDGYLKNMDVTITLGGYDKGEYKTLSMEADVTLSNINNTEVTKPLITERHENYEDLNGTMRFESHNGFTNTIEKKDNTKAPVETENTDITKDQDQDKDQAQDKTDTDVQDNGETQDNTNTDAQDNGETQDNTNTDAQDNGETQDNTNTDADVE